ncbi:MAG: hypothetical protein GX224_00390 [Thermoplasmatales archaeon]|nr:hypothetical protein [Thermoplasmatales archaeon]
MVSDLESNKHIEHPTEKGDHTNRKWIEWFSKYLPERYSVTSAFVFDSHGNSSDQIDVVIYDRVFSPPIINDGGSKHITAESVYAVFEVKQKITKAELEYAAKKAASVRALRREVAEFRHAMGVGKTEPKEILAGILGNRPTNMDADLPKGRSENSNPMETIQFGCDSKGAFFNDGKTVRLKTGDTAIVWFFYKLLSELQKIGSAPAIDYEKYIAQM